LISKQYVTPSVDFLIFNKSDDITTVTASSCPDWYIFCPKGYTDCHYEGTGICNPFDGCIVCPSSYTGN